MRYLCGRTCEGVVGERGIPPQDDASQDRPPSPDPDPAAPASAPATVPVGASAGEDEGAAPRLGQLTLIGAGHVFDIEQTIVDAIHAIRPERVFVELDRGRLVALVQKARGEEPPGAAKAGLVHRRLERFQSKVAQGYGTQVGGEMLAAVRAAQEIGAQLGLIDQPAQHTLQRVMKEMTVREKLRGFGLLFASPFRAMAARLRRSKRTETIEDEIQRYQADPGAVLDELGRHFPTVRRVVIDERDELMARRLRDGLVGIVHGVAVVGDGHVNGMIRHLSEMAPEVDTTVYRLADVREGRLPKPAVPTTVTGDDTDSVTFGFTVPG